MKIARLAILGVLIMLSLSLILAPTAYAQSAIGYSDNACTTIVTSSAAGVKVYGGGTTLAKNSFFQIVYSGAATGTVSGLSTSHGATTVCDITGVTPASAGTLTITLNSCTDVTCASTAFLANTNVTITGTPTFPVGVAPIVALLIVIYLVLLRNKKTIPARRQEG